MQFVFPFQATSTLEILEWKTDITESETGVEEAVSVRDIPDQTFEVTAFVPPANCAQLFNNLYTGLPFQWGLPLWHEAQTINYVSGTGFECVATGRTFTVGGYVILWKSPLDFQFAVISDLIPVDNINSAETMFVLLETSIATTTGVIVMPMVLGHLRGEPTRQFNGHDEFVTITFAVDQPALVESTAPKQFNNHDLFLPSEEGLLNGEREESTVLTRIDTFTSELGITAYDYTWNHAKATYPYNLFLDSIESTYAAKQWLYRRAGRYRRFWVPSWENDLNIVTSTSTSLTVKNDGFEDLSELGRTAVAIETTAGWFPRTLIYASTTGETSTFTITPAITGTILRVSWLGLKRLQSDRVEIHYLTGGLSKINLVLLEVSATPEDDYLLQTELGIPFYTEDSLPQALETVTDLEAATSQCRKISQLDQTTATDAVGAGAFVVVAVPDLGNYKIPVGEFIKVTTGKYVAIIGQVGATSFTLANPLETDEVIVQIRDTVTNRVVGIAPTVTSLAISAEGLTPIEVANQFFVILRA